jgi:hypothetical protein
VHPVELDKIPEIGGPALTPPARVQTCISLDFALLLQYKMGNLTIIERINDNPAKERQTQTF